MLKRLKNAKPRYKILIGLWIMIELISLPAAASVAFSITGKTAPLVAEPVETTEPGLAQYLVTHSVPFDVLVSGAKNDVNIIIEDAKSERDISSSCVHFLSANPRVIKTIDAPGNPDAPIATLFVTVTYDAGETPDISFEQVSFVPAALPCQSL
ncbi:hypothetical protein GCM10009069_01310 [Algimonas arctica]|uniref:Uncharacterized protein n=1 Tax=Algimonas arctica TaxID=1479486 RepID=A0A8J3G0Z7_9PROT|nr:hypothetical protein [Algimonas arctica]GHA81963.1 hypothetical protein GCM10009069_01310 [Algimonas arctica]